MSHSRGIYGEAEAVVEEALVLERETRWATEEMFGRRDRPMTDREQVNALWGAVERVGALALAMQNPMRSSPYADLGAKIAALTTDMLNDIRDTKVERVVIVEDKDD